MPLDFIWIVRQNYHDFTIMLMYVKTKGRHLYKCYGTIYGCFVKLLFK